MIPGITSSGGSVVSGGPVVGANTVSLLHFDGSDGSTTFTDEAGVIWTPNGNAQIDTAQSQFGGSSMLAAADGDFIDATDPVFASGVADFTAECWTRFTAVTGNHFLFTFQGGAGVYFLNFNNGWALFDGGSTNVIIGGTGTATVNTWHHVAIVRSSGTWELWVNGASIGTTGNFVNLTTGALRIGGNSVGTGSTKGWIDEWRYSNVARYTAPFTPTGPFS